MWSGAFAVLLSIAAAHTTVQAQPIAPVFAGELQLHQTLTLYLVHERGTDFTIHMKWNDEWQTYADRPRLIRVFDPQEQLLVRRLEPCERTAAPVPHYSIDIPVKATGPGVYQIPVIGFGGNLEFSTTPQMSWGVMGSPWLAGQRNQFADAWVYLPPRLESLNLAVDGVIDQLCFTNDSGAETLAIRGAERRASASLPADLEQVWRLNVSSPGAYRLDFAGLPIILCPDERSARAIRASVDILEDGTICFHKFQIRAHELLRRYRQMPASAFHVDVPSLVRFKDHWRHEAARNELLLGPYGVYASLPATLREQNLDGSSPWFGSIHTWRNAGQGPHGTQTERTENPWTRYDRLGLSRTAQSVGSLAAVYSINEPFNPLYRHEGLLCRIIIASLQELLLLQEHEIPLPVMPDNYYGGERSNIFSSFLRAFPFVVRECPDDVRAVWTDGLRRYVDHESISQVAYTVNQWVPIIKGLLQFAVSTEDDFTMRLIHTHVRWLLNRTMWDRGQQPAGYFDESGPDATYVGISTHFLAWIYKELKQRETDGLANDADRASAAALKESLRRCYDLLNHTVVPQPDGTIVGATNFSTRTPWNWTEAQFGGGLAIMADELPEAIPLAAKVWPATRSLSQEAGNRQRVEQALFERLHYLDFNAYTDRAIGPDTIGGGAEMHFAIWEHFATTRLSGELPAIAQKEFVRNFGDEYFCIRRPKYYTILYAGKPRPRWAGEQPSNPHQQFPRNGGGLSMFWSPAFGVSLLAQNWSAYSANTILVEHPAEYDEIRHVDWEDYWSVTNSFDEQRAEAVVTGTLRGQSIQYERCHQFLRAGVECTINLHAQDTAAFAAMWECFPYPVDLKPVLNVSLVDEQGRPVRNRPASAIVFRNSSHEAHIIVFAQPRRCVIGTERTVDHYGQPREFGRVLAELPLNWIAGQRHAVQWRMLAIPADRVAAEVHVAIQEMNQE